MNEAVISRGYVNYLDTLGALQYRCAEKGWILFAHSNNTWTFKNRFTKEERRFSFWSEALRYALDLLEQQEKSE